MVKENFKRIFCKVSKQDYAENVGIGKNISEQINIVKECLDGGCFYEFSIVWYPFPERDAVRLEIFDDAFIAFEEEKELFHCLSIMKNPTPDEVCSLLLKLGYKEYSDKEVKKNA